MIDIIAKYREAMKIKLKQLATVQMGYSFRARLEPLKSGNVAVIQMKDLLGDNTVACEELVKISMAKVKPHHFVQKGDLVFRSRGLVTTSAILAENPENVVVAAPLLRIRIQDQGRVLQAYLNWYISQRDAQIFLNSRAKGTLQKMISKQAVEDLPVVAPDLGRQKGIVELAQLAAREHYLQHLLSRRREQYMASLLMALQKKRNKND